MQEWNAPHRKKPIKKPTRRLTPWWRAMLDRVDRTRPEGWLAMSMRLLDVAYEDQQRFERGYRAAAKRLKKGWVMYPHGLTSVFSFGARSGDPPSSA